MLGVPIVAAIGIPTTVVLGFAYAYVTNWIPIIYAAFLATLAFGASIGWVVGRASTIGKIRNTTVTALLALAMGAIGLYVAWAVDPLARFGNAGAIVWNSAALWEYINIFYDNGFWGIGRGEGAAVSGIPLAIVWIIEAGTVFFLATTVAIGSCSTRPFCEACNRWTTWEEGVNHVLPPSPEVATRLTDGDLMALNDFERVGAGTIPHLRVDVATCPQCEESNYLTINAVSATADKDGNVSTTATPVIHNMIVHVDDIAMARQAGRAQEPSTPSKTADDADGAASPEAAMHEETEPNGG